MLDSSSRNVCRCTIDFISNTSIPTSSVLQSVNNANDHNDYNIGYITCHYRLCRVEKSSRFACFRLRRGFKPSTSVAFSLKTATVAASVSANPTDRSLRQSAAKMKSVGLSWKIASELLSGGSDDNWEQVGGRVGFKSSAQTTFVCENKILLFLLSAAEWKLHFRNTPSNCQGTNKAASF